MRERILQNYFKEILKTEEVKKFLRITGDYDDSLLESLSKSTIKFAEGFLGFELSHKEILLEGIFLKKIKLKTPFVQVNLVKSGDKDVDFQLEKNVLKPDLMVGESIQIIYEAGLMEDEVPEDLRSSLMQHLMSLYDTRINGGNVPHFSLEVYNRYRMVNL